jgi:hypothetical protein
LSIVTFENARIALRVGVAGVERFEGRDRLGSDRRKREITLQCFMSVRVTSKQSQRGDQDFLEEGNIRADRDRPARPFNGLIVLFRSEKGLGFSGSPKARIGIMRTEPRRLSKYSRLV